MDDLLYKHYILIRLCFLFTTEIAAALMVLLNFLRKCKYVKWWWRSQSCWPKCRSSEVCAVGSTGAACYSVFHVLITQSDKFTWGDTDLLSQVFIYLIPLLSSSHSASNTFKSLSAFFSKCHKSHIKILKLQSQECSVHVASTSVL